MQTGGDGIDLSHERRARGVYCKHCKQILDILHNRDGKPSPTLFDKLVLELHEHLTKEHTIGDDNMVRDMRHICIGLLESKPPGRQQGLFGR